MSSAQENIRSLQAEPSTPNKKLLSDPLPRSKGDCHESGPAFATTVNRSALLYTVGSLSNGAP